MTTSDSSLAGALCSSPWALTCLTALLFLVVTLPACASEDQQDPPVTSHLHGRITVSAEVDSSTDYSGFRVLVAEAQGRRVDTLAHAVTDTSGRFSATVTARERGVYPLLIWGRRGQQRLAASDFVVADGDTASLEVELPVRRNQLPIRSRENAALMAYRNTMVLHRRTLTERIGGDGFDENAMAQSIRQTSSILWDMGRTYEGTYAGQLGMVESLGLLEGWSDSLVIARARTIEPTNPRFAEAARITRRTVAQRAGQDSALAVVEWFRERAVSDDQRAALQSIIVMAHMDSLNQEAARAAAEALQDQYPDSKWADWAERAQYEVDNLLPGMQAPSLAGRTVRGDSVSLAGLRGRPVILEFYAPGNDLYKQQLSTRSAIYDATRADSVAFVSVSLEPDTLLNEAFREGRTFPGHHLIAPDGREGTWADTYNVAVVPTRVLIDADGAIVDKYVGSALLSMQDDLSRLIQDESAVPESSPAND